MLVLKRIAVALLALCLAVPAWSQSIQLAPGQVVGNATAAPRPGQATNISSLISFSNTPIVLFTSGQSNFVLEQTFAWTPNVNAKKWNYNNTGGNVGTAYAALPSTTINIVDKIASDIASATGRTVCLINISISSQAISHWLPATGAPDIYQDILNNVPAALTACAGATKIDYFEWWQGEADASPVLSLTYPANFATLITRLWGNSWFPREVPMIVHGIASNAISGGPNGDIFNVLLQSVVAADSDKRRFVYTADFTGATYWDTVLVGHMTGQGYFSAGVISANALLNGPGRTSPQNLYTDPATGNIVLGNPAASSVPLLLNQNTSYSPLAFSGVTQHIIGADGNSTLLLLDTYGNTFSGVIGRRGNGTQSAPTKLLSGNLITLYGAEGYDALGVVANNKADLAFFANEDWNDATHHGTYVDIRCTQNATNTLATCARFLTGSWNVFGATSGTGTLTWPTVLGTPTWTLPTGTGTFAVNASAPIVLNAATGNLTCPTCSTTASVLTFGTHLTSGGASYNGSANITLTSDATNANTASTIVARDGSGNFSAGAITASLTGHASLDLALTGGTMAGAIAMGSNNITGGGSATFTTFVGALTGNATTATTATNATNTAITDDTTTNANVFPTWVTANTGNLPQKVSSTIFAMNPSLGTFAMGTTPAAGSVLRVTNSATALTGINQFAMNFTPTCSTGATSFCGGYYAAVTSAAGSYTITGMAGIYIDADAKGAGSTVTTAYGLYVADQTVGATNYGVYSSGATNKNFFGGDTTLNAQAFAPNIASDTATTDNTVCIQTGGTGKLLKGTGTLGICLGTSGAQFKSAFAPMIGGLDEVSRLNFQNYRYLAGFGDGGARMQYGLTAQDVDLVLPDLVRHDTSGVAINYDSGALIFIGLRAIQQLKADNDNLHAEINNLKIMISDRNIK